MGEKGTTMERPAKVQEAVERFRKIGPPGIHEVFAQMSDAEKEACDRWLIKKYPELAALPLTIAERFEQGVKRETAL
jgi:hypothetical protein